MPGAPFFKSSMTGRVAEKRDRAKAKQQQLREVYRQVDRRDAGKCRSCGQSCSPTASSVLRRAHRHHIVFRSAGGQDTTSNLVTLCAACHEQVHLHQLSVSGNGDRSVSISNGWSAWTSEAKR